MEWSSVIHLLTGLGLATGSGLNPWVPTLGVAVAARIDMIDLSDRLSWMSSNAAIAVFAALLILDFVGDKIPALDSVVHAIGVIVHPIVGGAVVAAQANLLSDVHPALAWGAGALLGGGVHTGRSLLRPVVTAATAGLGNWLVSIIEDVTSIFLTLLAIIVPVLGFLAALGLIALIVRKVTRRRRSAADAPASTAASL